MFFHLTLLIIIHHTFAHMEESNMHASDCCGLVVVAADTAILSFTFNKCGQSESFFRCCWRVYRASRQQCKWNDEAAAAWRRLRDTYNLFNAQ